METTLFTHFLFTGELFRRKVPSPDYKPLKDYQERVVKTVERKRRFMVYHDTGTGKSLTAAHIANDYLKNPNHIVLCITPAATLPGFAVEVLKVTGNKKVFFLSYETVRDLFSKDKSPDIVRLFEKYLPNTMIICDEAHLIKITETKPVFETLSKAHKMILMTATPVKNKLSDLIPYMKLLNPGIEVNINNYPSFFKGKISVVGKSTTNKNFPSKLGPFNIPIRLNTNVSNNIRSKTMSSVSKAYALEQTVFNNHGIINPKFKIFKKIFDSNRQRRSVVYFEQLSTLAAFEKFVEQQYPTLKLAVIKGDIRNRNTLVKDLSFNIYAITSAGATGLDYKGINMIFFMEYPWTHSNYEQIVGRGIRRGSHLNVNRKNVKIFNLFFQSPTNAKVKFIDEHRLARVQHKESISDQVKSELQKVSIEQVTSNIGNNLKINIPLPVPPFKNSKNYIYNIKKGLFSTKTGQLMKLRNWEKLKTNKQVVVKKPVIKTPRKEFSLEKGPYVFTPKSTPKKTKKVTSLPSPKRLKYNV